MFPQITMRLAGWWKSMSSTAKKGKGGEEPAPWVTVAEVFEIVEATLLTARLQDEGITTRMRQEGASRALPFNVGILGRIDIQVAEPQVERALELLEELDQAKDDEGDSAVPD